jgi:protein-disulfide isomerase
MKEENNNLVIAIIVAAILIAGALVYFGSKMGGNGSSSKSFAEQLKEYQKEQEQNQLEKEKKVQEELKEKAKAVAPISEKDHILGNKDADITIYEYSDFECPFCKRFYETPEKLVKESDGKVNLVFRHFPLPFHGQIAEDEALATECAGEQGKFWEMHDAIFESTRSNGKGIEGGVTGIAKNINLDISKFNTCMNSKKYQSKIEADKLSGANAGVQGTPGNIIKNNKTGEVAVIPGAYPIEAVRDAINSLQK